MGTHYSRMTPTDRMSIQALLQAKPQRGSNENANGLVREYLPKGIDLSQVTHQQLTAIEHSLNHRPRKILNFHSPHEVFSALTADFIRGVTLQA